MNKKLHNVFEFFKSTLAVNLAASFFVFLFGGLAAFNCSVLTFGFALSLFFKEVNGKNEYVFYFNNQISKMQLWLHSWCFTFVFLAVCSFVFKLIIKIL
ncbi:hypothetical protein [Flavobacterium sp. A45]|uniref:hypothetical protein n=1 Tax=Flavobacterium sp. A45 TaxID=1945862 RepID=UPI000F4E26C7|nr:hypothetical protein [Flavobacterium sp. A45]